MTSTMAWTPHDLVILVPMLGRPHRVTPLLESIDATTPGCHILFCLTKGDRAVIGQVEHHQRPYALFPPRPRGDYANKINTGYRATTQPLIFTGADDLCFKPGWFDAAVAKLTPGIGVVGTNDLGSPRVMAGEHATHFLVTREYANRGTIDEPGKIFCEQYWHDFVDDELVATARHRNAYAHAGDSHVQHRHPNWDPSIPLDPMYAEQRIRMRQGRPIFERRRRLWS